ncbi:MAG TPA: redoxin domain-containing protein [Pyrinomonadaceae bacterium]|nr:redoxin domain-containing protein [Pyrinomonadaceae bacterium]
MQQEAQMLVGTQISVPNVDWQQNQKGLIFFLKKDCAFCTTSALFYRQVIEEAQQRNVKWLAILPDPLDVGREFDGKR